MRLRSGLIGFIAVIQSVLFLAHFLLYQTWTYALPSDARSWWIQVILGVLSVSFVTASLLAFRYTNGAIRFFYRAAAIWLGLLTFLVFAAVGAWILLGVTRAAGMELNFHRMVEVLVRRGGGYRAISEFSMPVGRESHERRCGSRTCRKRGADERLRSSATCIWVTCATAVFCDAWWRRF